MILQKTRLEGHPRDLVDYIFGFLHFHDFSVLHGCSRRVGEKIASVLKHRERKLTHNAEHDGPAGVWMRRLLDAGVRIRSMNMVRTVCSILTPIRLFWGISC